MSPTVVVGLKPTCALDFFFDQMKFKRRAKNLFACTLWGFWCTPIPVPNTSVQGAVFVSVPTATPGGLTVSHQKI
jgi:hypothetical protein